MIKAILIDDEVPCLDSLNILISDYCPEVQVMELCVSAKKALLAIERIKPGLVFLDIEMPVMNGFELLEQFKEISFSVIFTTGYDQYAIKAIHFSALDYLLKPIEPKELMAAVRKVDQQKQTPTEEQLTMLMDRLENKAKKNTKIAVPTVTGFELIPAENLLRCEADDNYTHLFLKDKQKITACRTLKDIDEQLEDYVFFIRVHNSHIVNLNEVTRYVKGDGGYVVMSDGSTVNVSRSRKDELLKRF
jgi:two-component system, LytTR family, response regulator